MSLRFIIANALIITTASLGGCKVSPPSEAGGVPSDATQLAKELQAEFAQMQALQPPALPPSKVTMFVDQSGSMDSARVAPLTYSHVQPILETLSQTGGTLAIGRICEDSNRSLVRITFPDPPEFDTASIPTPPEPPDTSQGNPYKNRERLAQYEEAMAAYGEKATTIQQQIATYQQKLSEHQAENRQRIQDIQPEIETILNQPRNCQTTDIQQAVQRANWFFEEPGTWSESPRTYAVFITDGLDSFSNESVELKAEQLLLVNGSGDMGVFQAIDHQRFESPSAALNVLAQWIQE